MLFLQPTVLSGLPRPWGETEPSSPSLSVEISRVLNHEGGWGLGIIIHSAKSCGLCNGGGFRFLRSPGV